MGRTVAKSGEKRMALGADRASVVGSVVANALLTAAVGLALGLAASFTLWRL